MTHQSMQNLGQLRTCQADKQLPETASAEQPEQLNDMQPAVDDWGDFVS